ncbi:hypothetical protein PMAYCL1PPCAC_29909, partial [Pristionchus mayeri]
SLHPLPSSNHSSSTMLTLLGRSVLSSALRLSPVYRTPLIYPVGSPCGGYRNPTRSYTTDGGSDYEDFGPIPPITMYTYGIRGSEEQGSHVGIGIFVEDYHEMNFCRPVPRTKETAVFTEKTPELQAIRIALWRLYKWPSYLKEDVIIRTHFGAVVEECENWRNGDVEGSRSLMDVWRQMDRFPNVRIEHAEIDDEYLENAIDRALIALEDAEMEAAKVKETKTPSKHLRHSLKYPLSVPSKKKDEKEDE